MVSTDECVANPISIVFENGNDVIFRSSSRDPINSSNSSPAPRQTGRDEYDDAEEDRQLFLKQQNVEEGTEKLRIQCMCESYKVFNEQKGNYYCATIIFVGILGLFVGILISHIGSISSPCSTSLKEGFWPTHHDSIVSRPPMFLIDTAKNRSKVYEHSIDAKYYQMSKNHPAFLHMDDKFLPTKEWEHTHLPDINILGLPKAGTSQLYNILVSHPQLRSFHFHAEFCYDIEDSTLTTLIYRTLGNESSREEHLRIQQAMYMANQERLHRNEHKYRQWQFLNLDTTQGNLTVNKCLTTTKYLMQRQYLQMRGNQDSVEEKNINRRDMKAIVMLRDPADWLWAAWNFWLQIPKEDVLPATTNNWASSPYQYRSPELFHEYMLAGERLWPSHHLLQAFRDEKVTLFQHLMLGAFDKKDVLVLKNEDMTPDKIESSGMITKLADFLGLDKNRFDTTVLYQYTNCGDNKGVNNHNCNEAKKPGTYEISRHRGMFEETRELVYLHFAEECRTWKEKFNVEYSECLAVRKKYLS